MTGFAERVRSAEGPSDETAHHMSFRSPDLCRTRFDSPIRTRRPAPRSTTASNLSRPPTLSTTSHNREPIPSNNPARRPRPRTRPRRRRRTTMLVLQRRQIGNRSRQRRRRNNRHSPARPTRRPRTRRSRRPRTPSSRGHTGRITEMGR
jgi:hypothetical protein